MSTETTQLLDAYFAALDETIREYGLPDDLLAAIRDRHSELVRTNAHQIIDEPSRANLLTTLALVAGYEVLRPRLGQAPAIEAVRRAFVEPIGEFVREGTRAMLDHAPDPFAAMVATSKARERDFYGDGFTFRRTIDDDQRYYVDIHKCFYHDVLTANGAAELTPAMCAFDANWIEAIDPDRHGFEFERRTTIGLGGGSHCPFHFRRRTQNRGSHMPQPRFHVRAPSNWINDPNGPIHHEGSYHLFFQRNPRSADWGPPNWGHATSLDLVHWTIQPDALLPTPGGPDEGGCWSGCTVANGSEVYALYTGIDPNGQQVVCAAVSQGDLRSWRKLPEPVIAAPPAELGFDLVGFRDPYVVPDGDGWLCLIGAGVQDERGMVLLYRSTDLLEWTYVGILLERDAGTRTPPRTGEMWECPQLFRVGDNETGTDVLGVSIWERQNTNYPVYFLGEFDGAVFTPTYLDRVDHGPDSYAQTSMRDPHGRQLMWGWSWEALDDDARRANGLAGCLTVPRHITVHDGRLRSAPIAELTRLRGQRLGYDSGSLQNERLLAADAGPYFDAELDIRLDAGNRVEIVLCASADGRERTILALDAEHGTATLDTTRSSLRSDVRTGRYAAALDLGDRQVHVRILRDGSILELFVAGLPFTARVYPSLPDSHGLSVAGSRGRAELVRAELWDVPDPAIEW